jgi:hypothetical protein
MPETEAATAVSRRRRAMGSKPYRMNARETHKISDCPPLPHDCKRNAQNFRLSLKKKSEYYSVPSDTPGKEKYKVFRVRYIRKERVAEGCARKES